MIQSFDIFPPTRTMPPEEAAIWAQFGCPATYPTRLPSDLKVPRTRLVPPEMAEFSAALSDFTAGLKSQPRDRLSWDQDFSFQDWVQDGKIIRAPFMARENSEGFLEIKRPAPLPEKWAGLIFYRDGGFWKYKEIPLIYWIQYGKADFGEKLSFEEMLNWEDFRSPLGENPSKLYSLPVLPWSPSGRWLCGHFNGTRNVLLAPDGRVIDGYGDVPFASIGAYAAFHRMKLVEVAHG